MTPADEARLAGIEARANAATPGSWRVEDALFHDIELTGAIIGPDDSRGYHTLVVHADSWPDDDGDGEVVPLCGGRTDFAFIAAAREDVPYLLALVKKLRAQADERLRRATDYGKLAQAAWHALRQSGACNPSLMAQQTMTIAAALRKAVEQGT